MLLIIMQVPVSCSSTRCRCGLPGKRPAGPAGRAVLLASCHIPQPHPDALHHCSLALGCCRCSTAEGDRTTHLLRHHLF